jgi:flagellar FliL protein
MAEKQDDIEVVEESGGGNKKKLLIIIVAVLLLVLIGLGAFLFLGGSEEEAPAEEAEAVEKVRQAPIYFTVDSPFIVNFSEQSNGAVRFMQVKMKVMARDQMVIDAFQLHQPAIQHEILMLLYSQNYDTLLTTEGTKALQKACRDKINEVIKKEETLENELEAVYFTSFIMQ